MAVAYLDSDCDLAKGPADIMRALLAAQGGRLEEPIELSGDDDDGVEEDDDDVDVELLPSPPGRPRMVEVVDLLSSDDETDVGVMGYPSAAPNVVANGDSVTGQFSGCECCANPFVSPLFSFPILTQTTPPRFSDHASADRHAFLCEGKEMEECDELIDELASD
jgi:hypothetical protein